MQDANSAAIMKYLSLTYFDKFHTRPYVVHCQIKPKRNKIKFQLC